MVKITDPNKEVKRTNKPEIIDNEILTEDSIKELLKNKEDTKNTTSIHLRLNNTIANQIKKYANLNDISVTGVITDILTDYYSKHRITKGALKLRTPVNLLIPITKELIYEYSEEKINLITALKKTDPNSYTINELDKQKDLFNKLGNESIILELTTVNNLLDYYNEENHCYYDIIGLNFKREFEKHFYHRGILKINLNEYTEEVTAEDPNNIIFIETLTKGRKLVLARIISDERAIDLAKASGNRSLIKLLVLSEEDNKVEKIINHRIQVINLQHIIHEKEDMIKGLNKRIYELEELNHEYKKEVAKHNGNDLDTIDYLEDITEENKKLKEKNKILLEKIKTYESLEEEVNNLQEDMKEDINKKVDKELKRIKEEITEEILNKMNKT